MKLYLAPYLAAVSIAVCSINRADASIARSSFSVARKASFGLATETVFRKIPRGGATMEVEPEVQADVPEVLYLPGLLEAIVVKNDQVCFLLARYS